MTNVIHLLSSIAPAKTAQDQLAEDEDFIFRVRTYIYSNLSDPDLNRSSIAEYLHMSPDYLSYVFHQKFNQTLSAYNYIHAHSETCFVFPLLHYTIPL